MNENEGVPIPVLEEKGPSVEDCYIKTDEYHVGIQEFGNMDIHIGEGDALLTIRLRERRTVANRLKWWAMCRVFPFRIARWEK
ncbi:MAG: hypothetical protein WC565_08230 [Parcubacteria group bacterium]